MNDANCKINYSELCQRLQIPKNDVSRRLFDLYRDSKEKTKECGDEVDTEEQLIDFREYLLTALLLIKFKQPVIELVELAFKVSRADGWTIGGRCSAGAIIDWI